MKQFFVAITTIGVMLGGAQAAVASQPEVRQLVVKIADLNLTTDAGAQTLRRRVQSAVNHVCSTGSRDLRALAQERRCAKLALAGSAEQVASAIEHARKNFAKAELPVSNSGSSLR